MKKTEKITVKDVRGIINALEMEKKQLSDDERNELKEYGTYIATKVAKILNGSLAKNKYFYEILFKILFCHSFTITYDEMVNCINCYVWICEKYVCTPAALKLWKNYITNNGEEILNFIINDF